MSTAGELAEYVRPWKLLSLAAGIALLVAGAFYYDAPDWDVAISFIMAILAYLSACGLLWYYRGSLRQACSEARVLLRSGA